MSLCPRCHFHMQYSSGVLTPLAQVHLAFLLFHEVFPDSMSLWGLFSSVLPWPFAYPWLWPLSLSVSPLLGWDCYSEKSIRLCVPRKGTENRHSVVFVKCSVVNRELLNLVPLIVVCSGAAERQWWVFSGWGSRGTAIDSSSLFLGVSPTPTTSLACLPVWLILGFSLALPGGSAPVTLPFGWFSPTSAQKNIARQYSNFPSFSSSDSSKAAGIEDDPGEGGLFSCTEVSDMWILTTVEVARNGCCVSKIDWLDSEFSSDGHFPLSWPTQALVPGRLDWTLYSPEASHGSGTHWLGPWDQSKLILSNWSSVHQWPLEVDFGIKL